MHRGVGQFTSREKWRLKSYYLPPMSYIPYTKICVSIIQRQREMLLAPLEEMLLAFLEEMLLASWGKCHLARDWKEFFNYSQGICSKMEVFQGTDAKGFFTGHPSTELTLENDQIF